MDTGSRRRGPEGRCRLHGPAPGGLDARLHRERGPHGPEAGGLRQLQPRDDGPRPRAPDPERLPRRGLHASGYVPPQRTCGSDSFAAKRNLVEIIRFTLFSRHVVFDGEGDKLRNKRIENHITVSVVIDMECGNTKN